MTPLQKGLFAAKREIFAKNLEGYSHKCSKIIKEFLKNSFVYFVSFVLSKVFAIDS